MLRMVEKKDLLRGKGVIMKDQRILFCAEPGVYFGGEISDGKLSLVSEVYGDGFDSERRYVFSQQETTRLFESISVEKFVEMCRQEGVAGLDRYLSEHRIVCQCVTI